MMESFLTASEKGNRTNKVGAGVPKKARRAIRGKKRHKTPADATTDFKKQGGPAARLPCNDSKPSGYRE